MHDDPFHERLRRLEERIEGAKVRRDGPPRRRHVDGSALGWRMVTELVAGIAIGLVIGYGLDSLLGTRPAFLVLFALLGFAAGVRTMLRSAQELQRRPPETRESEEGADSGSAETGDGGPAGRRRD